MIVRLYLALCCILICLLSGRTEVFAQKTPSVDAKKAKMQLQNKATSEAITSKIKPKKNNAKSSNPRNPVKNTRTPEEKKAVQRYQSSQISKSQPITNQPVMRAAKPIHPINDDSRPHRERLRFYKSQQKMMVDAMPITVTPIKRYVLPKNPVNHNILSYEDQKAIYRNQNNAISKGMPITVTPMKRNVSAKNPVNHNILSYEDQKTIYRLKNKQIAGIGNITVKPIKRYILPKNPVNHNITPWGEQKARMRIQNNLISKKGPILVSTKMNAPIMPKNPVEHNIKPWNEQIAAKQQANKELLEVGIYYKKRFKIKDAHPTAKYLHLLHKPSMHQNLKYRQRIGKKTRQNRKRNLPIFLRKKLKKDKYNDLEKGMWMELRPMPDVPSPSQPPEKGETPNAPEQEQE